MSAREQVGTKLDGATKARVEAHRARLSRATPGREPATSAEALRDLLRRGLDVAEREAAPESAVGQ